MLTCDLLCMMGETPDEPLPPVCCVPSRKHEHACAKICHAVQLCVLKSYMDIQRHGFSCVLLPRTLCFLQYLRPPQPKLSFTTFSASEASRPKVDTNSKHASYSLISSCESTSRGSCCALAMGQREWFLPRGAPFPISPRTARLGRIFAPGKRRDVSPVMYLAFVLHTPERLLCGNCNVAGDARG